MTAVALQGSSMGPGLVEPVDDGKVRVRLHYGGTFTQDSSHTWRYVGGEVFNESFPIRCGYAEVSKRLNDKFGDTVSFRYLCPGDEVDPDNLVQVQGDDDLQEMYDEYLSALHKANTPAKTVRIRVFVFRAVIFEREVQDTKEDFPESDKVRGELLSMDFSNDPEECGPHWSDWGEPDELEATESSMPSAQPSMDTEANQSGMATVAAAAATAALQNISMGVASFSMGKAAQLAVAGGARGLGGWSPLLNRAPGGAFPFGDLQRNGYGPSAIQSGPGALQSAGRMSNAGEGGGDSWHAGGSAGWAGGSAGWAGAGAGADWAGACAGWMGAGTVAALTAGAVMEQEGAEGAVFDGADAHAYAYAGAEAETGDGLGCAEPGFGQGDEEAADVEVLHWEQVDDDEDWSQGLQQGGGPALGGGWQREWQERAREQEIERERPQRRQEWQEQQQHEERQGQQQWDSGKPSELVGQFFCDEELDPYGEDDAAPQYGPRVAGARGVREGSASDGAVRTQPRAADMAAYAEELELHFGAKGAGHREPLAGAAAADLLPRHISAFGESSRDASRGGSSGGGVGGNGQADSGPNLPSRISIFGDQSLSGTPGGSGVRQACINTGGLHRLAVLSGAAGSRWPDPHLDGAAPSCDQDSAAGGLGYPVGVAGDSRLCITQEFGGDAKGRSSDMDPAAGGEDGDGGEGGGRGAGVLAPLDPSQAGPGHGGLHDPAELGLVGSNPLRGVVKKRKSEVVIMTKIGEGAFGEVSQAQVFPYGIVAVKWLKRDRFAKYSESFQREAETLAKLNHPNIIRMYGLVMDTQGPPGQADGAQGGSGGSGSGGGGSGGAGASAGTPTGLIGGIITEFVRNGSLGQYLRALGGRRLALRQRAMIALQAALGMAYLHEQEPAVVHFDLKPDNLLVDGEGDSMVIKVADFGLSKHKLSSHVSCRDLRGTLPYMAYELVSNSGGISEKVDVYSMGVVMWEMYTLEVPFAHLSAQEILMGLLHGNLHLAIPPACEPEWRSLVETCMDPNPANRPSFQQLAMQLQEILRLERQTSNASTASAAAAAAAAAALQSSGGATGAAAAAMAGADSDSNGAQRAGGLLGGENGGSAGILQQWRLPALLLQPQLTAAQQQPAQHPPTQPRTPLGLPPQPPQQLLMRTSPQLPHQPQPPQPQGLQALPHQPPQPIARQSPQLELPRALHAPPLLLPQQLAPQPPSQQMQHRQPQQGQHYGIAQPYAHMPYAPAPPPPVAQPPAPMLFASPHMGQVVAPPQPRPPPMPHFALAGLHQPPSIFPPQPQQLVQHMNGLYGLAAGAANAGLPALVGWNERGV